MTNTPSSPTMMPAFVSPSCRRAYTPVVNSTISAAAVLLILDVPSL
jgi:hypothetical protein